jgi:capsid portal protein
MQLDDMTAQPVVWFKEFGDPRVISRSTGEVYTDEASMREKEPNAKPATEILHFKIHSVRDSAYGIPRFAPAMPAVLGSRENEEVNLAYFENKSVPPLALLVNGGRLGKSAMTKLEDFFEENLKGKKNFHRILILEAEPSKGLGNGPSAVPKIAFERLRDQQQQDALFQVYDERNEAKVGSQYRMPRILRGDDRNINRATVFGSIRLAEDQVFEPERNDFDAIVNVKLLSALGIRFWRFRSNAPVTRDPEILGAIVSDMVRFGILTPAEARELAKDIFSKDFATIDAQWMHQPLMLTLALVKNGMAPEAVLGASSTKDALAARAQEQVPAPAAGNGANGAVVPATASAPKIQEGEA